MADAGMYYTESARCAPPNIQHGEQWVPACATLGGKAHEFCTTVSLCHDTPTRHVEPGLLMMPSKQNDKASSYPAHSNAHAHTYLRQTVYPHYIHTVHTHTHSHTHHTHTTQTLHTHVSHATHSMQIYTRLLYRPHGR
jgi:hypothetical protein